MITEIYNDEDDFFDMFDDDTFDHEELFDDSNGRINGWLGFAKGNLVASFNYYTFEGWYDDSLVQVLSPTAE
jgi:hypothetical protein